MSPEERELLQRSVELAEENNKMLYSIRRSMRLARIMSILYWVVIIGTALGALYLIQPYIDSITNLYNETKGTINSVNSGTNQIKDLLDILK